MELVRAVHPYLASWSPCESLSSKYPPGNDTEKQQKGWLPVIKNSNRCLFIKVLLYLITVVSHYSGVGRQIHFLHDTFSAHGQGDSKAYGAVWITCDYFPCHSIALSVIDLCIDFVFILGLLEIYLIILKIIWNKLLCTVFLNAQRNVYPSIAICTFESNVFISWPLFLYFKVLKYC